MAMIPSVLATELRDGIGFTGPESQQLLGWSSGVIKGIRMGLVSNAPGTVVGVCPAGGALSAGAATAGLISGITPTAMAAFIQADAAYPFTSYQLVAHCTAISQHVMSGTVVFSTGDITGVCTNTPTSPGAVIAGGIMGKII